jgi:hypothetical protein
VSYRKNVEDPRLAQAFRPAICIAFTHYLHAELMLCASQFEWIKHRDNDSGGRVMLKHVKPQHGKRSTTVGSDIRSRP